MRQMNLTGTAHSRGRIRLAILNRVTGLSRSLMFYPKSRVGFIPHDFAASPRWPPLEICRLFQILLSLLEFCRKRNQYLICLETMTTATIDF